MKTVAFLGSGNMGGAMLKAIALNDKKIASVRIYDKDIAKVNNICEETGHLPCNDIKEALKGADIVFIAVKPDVVKTLLNDIKEDCKNKLIISIAAGVPIKTFTDILGEDISIVRTIPNLPAMISEGMTGMFFSNVTKEDCEYVKGLFSCFGKHVTVSKEEHIDEMIAVTSSSPAYVCMFIEALADGAVKAGFKREDAYMMALQSVLGTSKLLMEMNIHPAVLKDQVCSPGGTTIEAVASLEKTGFRNSILEAMKVVSIKVNNMRKGIKE